MSEIKTNSNSFLEKFKGKTNKVSKNGLNQALKNNINQPINKQNFYSFDSAGSRSVQSQQSGKLDLKKIVDDLFPHNPEHKKVRNRQYVKLQALSNSNSRVPQHLPSLYSPQQLIGKQVKQRNKSFIESKTTPSEEQSSNSQKKGKYVFGKYLKLDEEAKKHFQFLKSIQKRSILGKQKSKIISR